MKNKDIKRPPSEAETIKDDISDVEVVVTGMDTDFLKTGYILNNRFVIKKSLGKGGMGVVYHAWDEELEQDVVIKLIRGDIISGTIIDRLKREIKLARKIGHKGIARVYDIGDHKGFKYISMELIHGETLHDIIQNKKRLNLKEFLDYAIQITDAINAAHEENIVHRDLKLGNIMITDDGTVKVLDFGLAYSPEEKKITRTDAMMGTMEYIYPEQAEGKTPTAQSDIYSLSVIFFNMITGNLPYQGDSPIATAMKHITEKVPAPSSFIKDIPVELEEIIIKGMQKKPKDRFCDCRELLAELKRLEGLVTEGKTGRLSIVRLIKKPLFAAAFATLLILVVLYFVVLKPAPVDLNFLYFAVKVV